LINENGEEGDGVYAADIKVYRPDGGLFATGTMTTYCDGLLCPGRTGRGVVNLASLPVTGIYTVTIQRTQGNNGQIHMGVSHPLTGYIGSGVSGSGGFELGMGQGILATFDGEAGSVYTVIASGNNTQVHDVRISVFRPDDTFIASQDFELSCYAQ